MPCVIQGLFGFRAITFLRCFGKCLLYKPENLLIKFSLCLLFLFHRFMMELYFFQYVLVCLRLFRRVPVRLRLFRLTSARFSLPHPISGRSSMSRHVSIDLVGLFRAIFCRPFQPVPRSLSQTFSDCSSLFHAV